VAQRGDDRVCGAEGRAGEDPGIPDRVGGGGSGVAGAVRSEGGGRDRVGEGERRQAVWVGYVVGEEGKRS